MSIAKTQLLELERLAESVKLIKTQYVNERRQYELQAALLRAEVEYLEEKQRRQRGQSPESFALPPPAQEESAGHAAPTTTAATSTSTSSTVTPSHPASTPSAPSLPSVPSVREEASAAAEDSKRDWIVGSMRDSEPSVRLELVHTFEHDSVVCTTGFSPDKKLFATGCNWTAQVYDVSTGEKQ